MRMLLVDDDPLMLRMLPGVLSRAFAAPDGIRTASTPQQALAMVREEPATPFLLLSDFNLKADMTGLQLLQHAYSARPDSVRVLMSGYAMDQIGIQDGAPALHGFIEKPLRIEDMIPPLRQILARAGLHAEP